MGEKKEYDVFVEDMDNFPEGEHELLIRELTPADRTKKYFTKRVKAVVSRNPEELSNGDILYVRHLVGHLHPQKWAIRIEQELNLVGKSALLRE